MNLKLIALAALMLLMRLDSLNAELQGPIKTSLKETDDNEEIHKTPNTAISEEKDNVKVEIIKDPESSNERKSSKYLSEQAEQQLLELPAHTKKLHQALLDRLWNKKLLREILVEQIEIIEASRLKKSALEATETLSASTEVEAESDAQSHSNEVKTDDKNFIHKSPEMQHLFARSQLAWMYLFGNGVSMDFEYAASEFEKLAKEGSPEGNMGLAFLYSIGVGGKNVSQPMALIHYTLAALGDNTFAQMALGYRYSFGINVPISCEKSLTYYQRVAKKVAAKVTFSNGPIVHRVRLLDESENPGSQETEIVDYYQLLADKGDVQSQVGLGQLYYQGGKAIQQDHQKALEYFTQAANAGNAIGYAFLGKLYLEGSEFIKADKETAFKYFKKAAELGDPVGQSGLGLMYLNGLGVPKDALKALNYFTQAADQGWVDGQLQLGNMYLSGNGVKTDYKLALKYLNLASQSGHVLAYYNLGLMHANGIGTLRSCPAAVEFFKNVAERGRWSQQLMQAYRNYKNYRIDEAYMQYALLAEMGYEVGQSNSAFLLDRGDVTIFHDRHEDLIRAFYYWKRSAAQGYSAAQVKLGDYYYYGWGTGVDFETSAALYRKASEQQYNAQAMFNLGYMHEQGLGMKKDWHLAKRLYDLAAETNADAKVPVAIALLKLQILAQIETIKESPYKFIFYLDENIAANWDLYMIAALTLLLGFIMYRRRPTQPQQQQQQNVADVEETNAPDNIDNFATEISAASTNENVGSTTEPSVITSETSSDLTDQNKPSSSNSHSNSNTTSASSSKTLQSKVGEPSA